MRVFGSDQVTRVPGMWKRRTRLEQSLLVLFCCALVVLLALSIALGLTRPCPEQEELCMTAACVTTAADIFKSMDPTCSPCDDFYKFACNTWIADTTIIDQVSDRFSALSEKMTLKLKDILEQQDHEENGTLPTHFKKAQAFYVACNNRSQREEEGLKPFIDDIEYFGGFPALLGDKWDDSEFDYVEMMRKMLDRGYDNGILLSIALDRDYKNNSIERILVHQTNPGLSQVALFKEPSAVDLYASYTGIYTQYLCLEMKGCKFSQSTMAEITEAVQLEKNITEMLYNKDYLGDNKNTYHIMTIRNLTASANEIDWLKLITIYFPNITSITDDTEIMVTVPGFMKNFSRFISEVNKTPKGRRQLANYMVYRQLKDAAVHLSQNLKRAFYDFQGVLKGNPQIPDLWAECVSLTAALFDLSLASQYIRIFLPKERRKALQDLVEKIKVELENIIVHTSWMDGTTKQAAIKKLHSIYLMAVYPDGLLDDDRLDLWYEQMEVGESHYENFVRSNLFLCQKEVSGFGQPVDNTNWKYLPSSILESNAYYSGTNNSVFVPLGIAQSWFFEEKGPLYVNYGRMGFVLAHELSHAFDVKGAELDEKGNWHNWWENSTFAQFKANSMCMVNMFDNYFSKEANTTLNGSRTITENIADDIGIAEVYAAFKKAHQENPASKLPGLDLSVEQLFWFNYASIWCEKDTDDYYVELISSDEHSPSRYRVNSPLSNNRDFIRDFGCQKGDKMYLNKSHCHVWGVESNQK